MDSKHQKRHRLTNWIPKQDPSFCCIQETYLSKNDRHYLRVKVWKMSFQENRLKKQAGVTVLISSKIGFQPKIIKRKNDKGHVIVIKGKIHKDDIPILNIYGQNAMHSKFQDNSLQTLTEPFSTPYGKTNK
jgi:exonuclease III